MSLIAQRLLDSIEIRALKVFDQCDHQKCLVVEVANDGRHVLPLQVRHGAQASLPGYELVRLPFFAHRNWLQQPVGADGRFKFCKRCWIEFAPRLEGIRFYAGSGDSLKFRCSGIGWLACFDEGLQAAAKAAVPFGSCTVGAGWAPTTSVVNSDG